MLMQGGGQFAEHGDLPNGECPYSKYQGYEEQETEQNLFFYALQFLDFHSTLVPESLYAQSPYLSIGFLNADTLNLL